MIAWRPTSWKAMFWALCRAAEATQTALNIRSFGDALFITSAYPEAFQVGLNPNAAVFVPGGGVV